MISVTVLTKNNEETLATTLASLQKFPEVIVYDSGSIDQTLTVAARFSNVRIVHGKFIGFGPTHNAASALAKNDWILSIDSDEVLTKELAEELLQLTLETSNVYEIQRHNYFNGKWIRWCGGWYPDPVVRLYHRKTTRFTEDAVHEKILTDHTTIISCKHLLIHTPYRCLEDFLAKMQLYSTLFAEQNRGKKRASTASALLHSSAAFLKSYFLKKGFCGGKEGLIISFYNAHTTFYKYLKLAEVNTRD